MSRQNGVGWGRAWVSQVASRLSLPAEGPYLGVALFLVAGLLVVISLFSPKGPMITDQPKSLFLCAFDVMGLGELAVLFWLNRAFRCQKRWQREVLPFLLGCFFVVRLLCLTCVDSSVFDEEKTPLANRFVLFLACGLLWFSCDTEQQFREDDESREPVLDSSYPRRLLRYGFSGYGLWVASSLGAVDAIHRSAVHADALCLLFHLSLAFLMVSSVWWLVWNMLLRITQMPKKVSVSSLVVSSMFFLGIFIRACGGLPVGSLSRSWVIAGFLVWLLIACWKTETPPPRRQASEDEPLDVTPVMGAAMVFLFSIAMFFTVYWRKEEKDMVLTLMWLSSFFIGSLGYVFRRPLSRKVIVQVLAFMLALKPVLSSVFGIFD